MHQTQGALFMTALRHALACHIAESRIMPGRVRRSIVKRIAPDLLKDHSFNVPFYGMQYQGNVVNYIDRMVYFCGAHEKYMLYLFRDLIQKAPENYQVFLDVGANVGNHALYMSQLVGEVHAFEPYDKVRASLEENIRINALTNVHVHPVGLGNEEKKFPFYAPPDENLGAGSFFEDHQEYNQYMGELQVVVGDDWLRGLQIRRVDLIKMDIEGFERFALEGLKETLDRNRPVVVMELSPKTRETLPGAMEELQHLFPEEYRFYYFAVGNYDSGAYKLAPFTWDMQLKRQDVIAMPKDAAAVMGLS
jgi:FkbM family methyltransferase